VHSIQLGRHHRQLPEHISELSSDQYIYLVQVEMMLQRGHINLEESKVLLLYNFLDLKFKAEHNDNSLIALGQLLELIEVFYSSGPQGVSLSVECAVNLVPKIKLGLRHFQGPADALADITLKQFVRGLELAEGYRQQQEKRLLVKLASHLYCRVSLKGHVKPYSDENAHRNEKYFERLSEAQLLSIYYFFKSAVNYLTTQDIHLEDGRSYNFSVLFKSGEASGKSVGPSRVLFALSENNVFGDIEQTGKQNIVSSLIYMLDKHYEAESLKDKYQNDRT